ncbi:hypothetical protein FPOAC2_14577 [Fusarium poae]|nr:uncharacterized protein FPOAC1_012857 [Fusarium poae]KAG8664880.1 hypothetical protein FPOAC1_012857 [Fusarium poae]
MAPASALHRHQSSLESIIDFSAQPPLGPGLRLSASRRFYQIVNHFDASGSGNNGEYDRIKLVRLTYEYARSEESKGNFLSAFFQSAALPMDGEEAIDLGDADLEAKLRTSLFNFAEYLFDNFFLPLKASTKKTPQPSPATHSAVQRTQSEGQNFAGTPERVSALRGACLVRDRHRCVISRRFDQNEAFKRMSRYGDEARDDDGISLAGEAFDALEVAHILPHSLTQVNASLQLDPSKEAALAILNMFDSGAAFLIEGTDIDRPRNAMTLTHSLHMWFGDFRIFFESIDQQAHTYRINTFLPPGLLGGLLPVTRTLHLTETRSIDPPSPRLLAIHSAIAHILHLSAAGDYIDKMLQDMEENGVQEDGSTELDRLVKLRLNGWSVSEVSG